MFPPIHFGSITNKDLHTKKPIRLATGNTGQVFVPNKTTVMKQTDQTQEVFVTGTWHEETSGDSFATGGTRLEFKKDGKNWVNDDYDPMESQWKPSGKQRPILPQRDPQTNPTGTEVIKLKIGQGQVGADGYCRRHFPKRTSDD